MCMLSYFPPGIMPKYEHISNGAEVNPNGHGYAIVTGRAGQQRLSVFKSMNADEALERFMEVRAANPNGPALFHSRIATSGLVDITGCHPFKVGSDNRTVVAHNGILFHPDRTSTKSDTRIFAESILPRFGSLDSSRKFAKVEKFAGNGNKLLVLTVNPRYRRNAYLINGKLGHWVNGAWHSNYDYEGSWWSDYYTTKYGKPITATEGYEPWPCDICGQSNSVDTYTLICSMCDCCNDCRMMRADCMCYYGKTAYGVDDRRPSARTPDDEPWPYKTVKGRAVPLSETLTGSTIVRKERLAITSGGGWSENS